MWSLGYIVWEGLSVKWEGWGREGSWSYMEGICNKVYFE